MNTAKWYVQPADETLGPYDSPELRVMLRNGTITGDSAACREGSDQWQPLQSFPDFAPATEVKLTGVSIPFWDLVRLLVKLALASIPALIILSVLYVIAASTLFALFAALVGAQIAK